MGIREILGEVIKMEADAGCSVHDLDVTKEKKKAKGTKEKVMLGEAVGLKL